MHAALQTVELLLDVFSYLDHVDLAVVARTCSAFSDPALGYLWQHLAVFGPIVRLLPDGKISTYRKQSESWVGDGQREEYCYVSNLRHMEDKRSSPVASHWTP